MRISDWSSDVCSSDLELAGIVGDQPRPARTELARALGVEFFLELIEPAEVGDRIGELARGAAAVRRHDLPEEIMVPEAAAIVADLGRDLRRLAEDILDRLALEPRSEEHTSELQSLMRTS